ncbi:MAG: hypothetical protein A2252_01415 [Elusimicrobia bacterium RIFOXYA2_FULL_39_19]|nr:MAG: hypothetical protein A2252_01415 [Elusimicrobia bacterium RIFOXYA2_FULL_39_19]
MIRKIVIIILLVYGSYHGIKYLSETGKIEEYLDAHKDWKYIPVVYYNLGQFNTIFSNWDNGISNYKKILKNYPDTQWAPKAQFGLAHLYDEKEDRKKAIEEYKKLIDLYPESTDCNFSEKRIGVLKGY